MARHKTGSGDAPAWCYCYKMKYRSRKEAEGAARLTRQRYDVPQELLFYRCPDDRKVWHLTSKPKTRHRTDQAWWALQGQKQEEWEEYERLNRKLPTERSSMFTVLQRWGVHSDRTLKVPKSRQSGKVVRNPYRKTIKIRKAR